MDRAGNEGGADRADEEREPTAVARAYYRALDEHDYELLSSVLDPQFVHNRPDRTLSGRERFVRFMREERPQTDTSHPIERVYVPVSPESADRGGEAASEVVVRGRLLAPDGSEITSFVDVFAVGDGAIQRLRTFTG